MRSDQPEEYSFAIPVRTISVLNAREHWNARQRRVKAERTATRLCLPRSARGYFGRAPMGLDISLTRLSKGHCKLDREDNLPASLKGVRDELACQLGFDDAEEERVSWHYNQVPSQRAFSVVVHIRERRAKDLAYMEELKLFLAGRGP